MSAKRYPLPKRFNAAVSEKAYENLRGLNKKYNYGNNYLLTILLENIDVITNSEAVEKVFADFKKEFGAPPSGGTKDKE
jgi:hypothetical protein